MRDGGIVKHKILHFTIPHPLPRDAPRRTQRVLQKEAKGFFVLRQGSLSFLLFYPFALKTTPVWLFLPRNAEYTPQQRCQKAGGSHQNDLHHQHSLLCVLERASPAASKSDAPTKQKNAFGRISAHTTPAPKAASSRVL